MAESSYLTVQMDRVIERLDIISQVLLTEIETLNHLNKNLVAASENTDDIHNVIIAKLDKLIVLNHTLAEYKISGEITQAEKNYMKDIDI